jgi:hypothetical protein
MRFDWLAAEPLFHDWCAQADVVRSKQPTTHGNRHLDRNLNRFHSNEQRLCECPLRRRKVARGVVGIHTKAAKIRLVITPALHRSQNSRWTRLKMPSVIVSAENT